MTRIPWGGIYAVECVVNGRIYVGQSAQLEKRFKQHGFMLRNNYGINSRMTADMQEFGGESFRIVVLERVSDLRDLDRLEAAWMKRLGAHGPDGYNIQRMYPRRSQERS